MTAQAPNALTPANFSDIDQIRCGFWSRRGGVSEGIYRSLNCGFGSDDTPEHVAQNRHRVAAALNIAPDRLVTPRQTHSTRVHIADAPWPRTALPDADAVVTDRPGLAIGILTADCAPVLFVEPVRGLIGAAHAGWRGAVHGVLDEVIAVMEQLGGRRDAIRAAIGPCISGPAYEVGATFRRDVLALDPAADPFFFAHPQTAAIHFDLPGYEYVRLQKLGINTVERLTECTYSNESTYFSYRRTVHNGESDYGRQISAIMLT